MENVPGRQNLGLSQWGGFVPMTEEQGTAMGFSSVLNLPALLDTVPSQLAGAPGD